MTLMVNSIFSLLGQGRTSPWLPSNASNFTGDVDWLFNIVLGITVFFTVLILALMVYFVIRYRHTEGRMPEPSTSHSTALELTWTIIPTILVLGIFFYGFKGFVDMMGTPPNAYDIQAQAYTWGWNFTYPNGATDSELHVEADRPVRIVLQSNDVIHALYIPAFRLQKYVVPGRFNKMWLTPNFIRGKGDTTETVDFFCNLYCGTGHSQMIGKAYIHSAEDYKKWLADAADWTKKYTPVQAGENFYKKSGCSQCHSIDGVSGTGPSWKNLYGSQQPLSDGTTVLADEDYLRTSVLYPAKQVVKGYGNVMPSYMGQLKDRDIDAIIAYMKSISENYKGSPDDLNPKLPPSAPVKMNPLDKIEH
jgi:cytochrome c oxidase subunit II